MQLGFIVKVMSKGYSFMTDGVKMWEKGRYWKNPTEIIQKFHHINFEIVGDFYIDNGKYVFTEQYLKDRGYCCKNNCRHCPYTIVKKK